MESVGRLAGGVAHDFNNMLGVILGYTEMAMDFDNLEQDIYNYLKEINKAADHSADITRQLLAFARKQTISPKLLNLNKTVPGMLKMLQRLIGENIELNWLPTKDLWRVKVDPNQIDQVLVNLCLNARDSIENTGTITIETSMVDFDEDYCEDHYGFVVGDFVMLSVSDDGSGMDTDTLQHIFEPFFTTKGMNKGTGLGLATVYGIVRQNQGFINVYSEPGIGTTFKIYFPRSEGEAESAITRDSPVTHVRGSETILLVEDEPSILNMTMRMLEKLGYNVLAANTPKQAIDMAREHSGKIQMLMTDVVMPEINGRELADILLTFNPNMHYLFMSGYTTNVIAHHGILDEGVNFIQKPFSMDELAVKVRKAITGGVITVS